MVEIDKIVNSLMGSITYILYKENSTDCVLIDCGYSEKLISSLMALGRRVKAVFLTHAHYDHIYGLNILYEYCPEALIYTTEEGKEALIDIKKNFSKYHPDLNPFVLKHPENVRLVSEGEIEIFKGVSIQVLFTPGHDVSCCSFIVENNLFTGDAYIPGIKTVMNFPRSNRQDAKLSLEFLKNLEMDGYKVCPGHDINSVITYNI